eukprot:3093651-Pyramimonas_sp.AAC.1
MPPRSGLGPSTALGHLKESRDNAEGRLVAPLHARLRLPAQPCQAKRLDGLTRAEFDPGLMNLGLR